MINVGISCRITESLDYGEVRNSLALDWIELFQRIGVNPVLIPNGLVDIDTFCSDLSIKAIVLSGGNNVSPELYSSDVDLEDVYDIRDSTEIRIIQTCISTQIPLIGICRGMSMINVYFGGSITPNVNGHVSVRHKVNLKGGVLSNLEALSVNSFHDHAIREIDLASELIPFAVSEDGGVEGVRHKNLAIFGVYWHPERDLEELVTIEFLRRIMYGEF